MNKHFGSSVESLFEELGELDEVRVRASKKIVAEQFRRSMETQHVSQKALAARMDTSRTVVNRLLDPDDTGVTLATLVKASAALGMQLSLHLKEDPARDKAKASRVRRTKDRARRPG
jgi:antitoxin HicB